MFLTRVLRRSYLYSFLSQHCENPLIMSAKRIVDTFNEIDKELVYVKNKLDSMSAILGNPNQPDASAELQKLKDENKNIQRDVLEILKQITVHDVLRGQPPLALKIFLQNQKVTASTVETGTNLESKQPVVEKVKNDDCKKAGKGETTVSAENKSTDKKKSEKTKELVKPKTDEHGDAANKVEKESDEAITVARLDFRVGKIVNVEKHPDAESLYVEKIDLGEEEPRTIVSGLVKFVPIEQMKDRLVVVLCNLKPAKMRGVMSEGMVMCASTPEKVEILIPPKGSKPGDRVSCADFPGAPDTQLNPKKKIWETIAPDLSVNPQKVATYKGHPLIVPGKGNVVSSTLVACPVK